MSFNYLGNLGNTINLFKTSLLRSSSAIAKPATAMPIKTNVKAEVYGNFIHITKQNFQVATDLPHEIFRANAIVESAKLQKKYFDVLSPLFQNLEENHDHLMEAIRKDDAQALEKMKNITNIINTSYLKINALAKELNNCLDSTEKKASVILESVEKKKEMIEYANSDSKALFYEEYSNELFDLSSYFGIDSFDPESRNSLKLLLSTNLPQNILAQKNILNGNATTEVSNVEKQFHKLCNLEDVQGKIGGIKYMQSFLEGLKIKLEETAQSLVLSTNLSLAKKLIIDAQDEKEGWKSLKSIGLLEIADKDSNLLLKDINNPKKNNILELEKEHQVTLFNFVGTNNKNSLIEQSFILKENDRVSRNNFTNLYNSYKDTLLSNAKDNLRYIREIVEQSVQKSNAHMAEAQMQFTQEAEKRENVIQNHLYTEFQRLKYMEMIVPQIISSLNKVDEAIYSAFGNAG